MRRTMLGMLCLVAVLAVVTAVPAEAQSAVLRGSVRTDNGEAIVGANVYVTEVGSQAPTNDRGAFMLTVPGDRVRGQQVQLRVRAIGYRPSSRMVTLVAGEQTVDFTLAADINRLEEIVVTGVMEGTAQARVPFAVSSVDMADVPVPGIDPLRMLAGRVPGANITSASGRPGSTAAVILRGPTSINATGRGQGPLYIIDGTVVNGALPDINPSDIENIEVVKGAAASSLYGARAGNGVIQITTRSGRRSADGVTWNVRGEAGISDIEGTLPLARQTGIILDETGNRYCATSTPSNATVQGVCGGHTIDWRAEVARVNNQPGDFALTNVPFALDPGPSLGGAALRNGYQAQLYPGTTYQPVDQAVKPQGFQQFTADMTGRFGETTVFASFGALNQAGAIRFLEGYDRLSGRLNVDQRLGGRMTVSLRSYYARSKADGLDQEGAGAAFASLARMPATVNIMGTDTLGRLHVAPNLYCCGNGRTNPLISLQNQQDIALTDRFIGGLSWRYAPASWVDLEANGSLDLQNQEQDFFRDKGFRTASSAPATNNGFIRQFSSRDQSFNTSMNATFRRQLARNIASRFQLRALYEQQDYNDRQGQGNTLGAVGVSTLNNATAGQQIQSESRSIRQIGIFGGVNFDLFEGRYIVDALVRRDGTSLFGSENRWATFGRMSLAWRPSAESWWFGGTAVNDLKLRFSRGSAGGRPSFVAQYETFGVTTTGPVFQNQGNKDLRPEITVDNEFGFDAELFRRFGVQVTWANSETRDQILLVPRPVGVGFGQQWRNAGTLENKTFELAVNIPVITRRNLNWSWRLTYDRTKTTITELDVPPFTFGPFTTNNTNTIFEARAGERYATFYGRTYVYDCSQLPAPFSTDCGGATSSFQRNDEGFIVWVGAGNNVGDGITRNLYQTQIDGCVNGTTGVAAACSAAGSVANAPWGVSMNWGMPIILRSDACNTTPSPTCAAQRVALGNGLPDWQFAVSQTLQVGRVSLFGLLQGVMGREVWNQGHHWMHFDMISTNVDQRGKSVETAKPVGYYWRNGPADGFAGIGGLYDGLNPNSFHTMSTSYAKLRELSLSYSIGSIRGVGNWTASIIGRNLLTITDYNGFDPEVGQTGNNGGNGIANSAAVNATDSFNFPNLRTFTFALSTSF